MRSADPPRATTTVIMPDLVEVPVLPEVERRELIAELEQAREAIARGEGLRFTPESFDSIIAEKLAARRSLRKSG